MNTIIQLLAMTPDQFSSEAAAWIKAFTDVLVPLGILVGAVFAFLAFVKAKAMELRMDRQSQRIDNVMLNTPPPGAAPTVIVAPAAPTSAPPEVQKVDVVNPPEDPANVRAS